MNLVANQKEKQSETTDEANIIENYLINEDRLAIFDNDSKPDEN